VDRPLPSLVLIALLSAACGAGIAGSGAPGSDGGRDGAAMSSSSPARSREPIRSVSEGCSPGGFHWLQADCLPAHSIPLEEIVAGGPPPDGIPPIDAPVYESIAEAATWLDDASPVMVVEVAGDVRAYQLAILTWHGIVNDTVGGVPLVIEKGARKNEK